MFYASGAEVRAQNVFKRVRFAHGSPHQADILTGFIGADARRQLEDLGIRRARIVLGLSSEKAIVPRALFRSIAELARDGFAEVRISKGLHAKVYIFDGHQVILGSANLSRSGWEKLREFVVLTDDRKMVKSAIAYFNGVWGKADCPQLTAVPSSRGKGAGIDPAVGALGTAFAPLARPQSEKYPQVSAGERGTGSTKIKKNQPGGNNLGQRRVRIMANMAYHLDRDDQIISGKTTYWNAPTSTRQGDILVFCFSKNVIGVPHLRDDARVDAVHSIWRATGRDKFYRSNTEWPHQYQFELSVRLKQPVKCRDLFEAGVLGHDRWPQGSAGKVLSDAEEVMGLARVLSKFNPPQRAKIHKALGL